MKDRIKTVPSEIDVHLIHGNMWNTHRAKTDDPDFRGLVGNILAVGMMHRVLVRPSGDTDFEIIDGHRRFDAALALGWSEVPCEIVVGLTDEEAQERTVAANVQRLENDPLLEAALIERLAGAGKTYEQIAAVLGKDARYVARRARLCNLSDKWRDVFSRCEADAGTMEMVAAHERELQDEVVERFDFDDGEGVDPDDIERAFRQRMRNIDDAIFDTDKAGCKSCPYNTATHGWLFADDEDARCGRCEKEKCYVRHWNEAVDAKIEALRKKRVEVREARQKWDVPNSWNATDRKTCRNTQPWVYTENELKHLAWTAPKAEKANSAPAMTEEEKAEAKRVKRLRKALRTAYDKLRAIGKDSAETLAAALVEDDRWRDRQRRRMAAQFEGGYASDDAVAEVFAFVKAKRLDSLGLTLTEEEAEAVLTDENGEGIGK